MARGTPGVSYFLYTSSGLQNSSSSSLPPRPLTPGDDTVADSTADRYFATGPRIHRYKYTDIHIYVYRSLFIYIYYTLYTCITVGTLFSGG